jgi:hypothetical protein
MERFGLRNDQWERIKDVLPGREGHVGGTAEDNRLFVEAVLYRFRTGCPWRDLPERFGHWKAVHQRFGRWAKSGVFEREQEPGGGGARLRAHGESIAVLGGEASTLPLPAAPLSRGIRP